jgi:hypothetical protein
VKTSNHYSSNAPVPFLMGIEERLIREAEENIGDGTYIIDLDNNRVCNANYFHSHLSFLDH